MRISKHCCQVVCSAIVEVLSQGAENPKRFLTEHDLQAWIFHELVKKLQVGGAEGKLGVHCQTRFLDSDGLLLIEPDIAILNLDEYTVGVDGLLTKRKGYALWGSTILVEIKLVRGCRKLALLDALFDMDKLNIIRELHYHNPGENCEYHPVFVLFSQAALSDKDRGVLEAHAENRKVCILMMDAKQNS